MNDKTRVQNVSFIIKFEEIFEYRNIWMAFAICWIVLFHSPISLPGVLHAIKVLGYGGVDIFLFASGIGCYFSLNQQSDIKRYLLRRVSKIFPMWIIFLLIFTVFKLFYSSISLIEVIGNIFGVGFFANLANQFNWYIGAMWVCYLLAPAFKSVVSKTAPKHIVLTLLGLLIMSTVFFQQFQLIFWSRLPIFFLGIVTADLSIKRTGLTVRNCVLIFASMVIGLVLLYIVLTRFEHLLWSFGLWWYPFLLITPGLTLLISIIAKQISNTKAKTAIVLIDKLGQNTFPAYLSHMFIFEVFAQTGLGTRIGNGVVSYVILLACTVLFAVVLNYLASFARYIRR